MRSVVRKRQSIFAADMPTQSSSYMRVEMCATAHSTIVYSQFPALQCKIHASGPLEGKDIASLQLRNELSIVLKFISPYWSHLGMEVTCSAGVLTQLSCHWRERVLAVDAPTASLLTRSVLHCAKPAFFPAVGTFTA